ncbi:long-chain fatty acid transport protein [Verticillium alfalfae VaMs.102]|uniref:Long-chain fatty acid transport protein n=1 Tax=Verticillium alfalfae (strain VaMs.102 / ATCC MYA-4576 / FGSC 10136) TaxID=526221 RepID=C9SND9_VERA1|nr:long-chain fatty acid transport protein [Verticillium alfalfae VaMs.102]EEY20304.1 long-chain fatty acid transport protein [Verticillium alfalfae VaMs.102]
MPPALRVPAEKVAIAASAAAATVVGALYANSRYGVSYDINQLLAEKSFRKRFQKRVDTLGNDVSVFHMFELADQRAEALWFEGRTWTYGEVLAVCTPDVAPAIADLKGEGTPSVVFSLNLSSFPPLQLSPDICTASDITQLRYEDLAAIKDDTVLRPKRVLKDVGALVYTSGTSGKPKAVAPWATGCIEMSGCSSRNDSASLRFGRFIAQLKASPSLITWHAQPAAAGMVGFAGPLKLYAEDDTFLVKYDATTEEPYRDPKTGFCVRAEADEPGEAIGRVRSMDFLNDYHGDKAATDLKLISNVFEKGDVFQRTGDLLVRQSTGWVRFHDRSGDTFRWRGENVSASEVREHIGKLEGVQDTSVYAVKLPG